MISNYDRSLKFVLRWEGGYVNDPDDPGGATNYGVTQKTYDFFRRLMGRAKLAVRYITLAEVGEIYKKHYWDACKLDNELWPIDIVMFDTAINCGVSRAINWKRLAAITAKNDDEIAMGIIMYREEHYNNIIRNRPSQAKWRRGWMNRLESLKKEVWG